MKKHHVLSMLLRVLLCAVAVFLMFWFLLPPLNPRSGDFWKFLVEAAIVCIIINSFAKLIAFFRRASEGKLFDGGSHNPFKNMGKPLLITLIAAGCIVVFGAAASVVGSEFFNASKYNELLTLTDSNFAEDVKPLEDDTSDGADVLKMDEIPIVDKETAQTLGTRKLGEMTDLVSQFEIADNYTQINYNNTPVRVTPLSYSDPIKWFNNQSEGIPGYIVVDMATLNNTKLVMLDEGIKYSESEYFMRNIHRYLRFHYPTKIFDNITFEIDEEGTPYWVASTVKFRIALWNGRDIDGAVLVNAITGESKFYALEEIPTWVDQVFSADMILKQLEYNGKYRSGFWNSIFGQKGVLKPTEGYNYIAKDDDVWLYTGITSVVSDESNVGFVLVNMRTKEAKYYTQAGAEEYSAMDSAQGEVQDLGYKASFPVLVNVSGRATYFMSLKDDASLPKMYAFVDMEQYQIVGTGSTPTLAKEDFLTKLKNSNISVDGDQTEETPVQTQTVTGVVSSVQTAVVDGNTKYYVLLENSDTIYTLDISLSDRLPFLKSGDTLTLEVEIAGDTTTVKSVQMGATTIE